MLGRLLNALGMGRVSLVEDGGPVQTLQVTEGAFGSDYPDRLMQDVPRVAEYGFATSPPLGAEALLLKRGGAVVVVGTSHRPSRPRGLKAGDVVLYDLRGRAIRLTDKGVEVDAKGGTVTVANATKVRCTCDIETTGDVIARTGGARVSLTGLYDAYNRHNHPPVAGAVTWGSGPPVPRAGA